MGAISRAAGAPLSRVEFRFLPVDFLTHWNRCGLSANFLAEFQSYDYENRTRLINIISTVMNELVENAIKFSAKGREEVRVCVSNFSSDIEIEISNVSEGKHAQHLSKMVSQIQETDPEELFLNQIVASAESHADESGLGLITICKDFGARVEFNCEALDNGNLHIVTLKVILNTLQGGML